ncbi:unnamed protein product, partial [marine sediment metagenome]
VIISKERGRRPLDYKIKTEEKKKDSCVFCEGNEGETPPEIFAFREKGTTENKPGWKVRVVPNKYPALKMEERVATLKKVGMFWKMDGLGVHEVIIETPYHHKDFDNLNIDNIVLILKTYRQRYLDLSKDKRIKYILIFKNYGINGGASLEHPHSQLIGTPIIPQRVKEELNGGKEYFDHNGRCIFCDYVKQEIESKKRLIKETKKYVVISPFAARFPFETWIFPKYHNAYYEKTNDNDILSLAIIMKETLFKI